jgi:prepilin peptidase CpaA
VQIATIGLLATLLLLLATAAAMDVRARTIPNWLTLAVALLAVAWWIAIGLDGGAILLRIGCAAALLLILAGLFALGAIGGGDVKLLVALALWLSPWTLLHLLVWMGFAGGVLSIFMVGLHRLRGRSDTIEVPYGIAISVPATIIIANQILIIAMR